MAHFLLVLTKVLGQECQFTDDSFAVVAICRGWC
jgi:hypothetical protein